MSSRSNKKIPTDGGTFGANPFAGLDTAGLPSREANVNEFIPSGKAASRKKPSAQSSGRVEVRREKAGRGGKTVTTLREFPSHLALSKLEAMAFDLKKACACGGSLKGRVIELQGDVRDRVCAELDARGYHAVRAGG